MSPCIDQVCRVEQLTEAGSFFRSETSHLFFAERVVDVLLAMCHVQVSSYYYWFCLLKLVNVFFEILIPFIYAVVKSFKLVSGIWHIHTDQIKLCKICSYYSSFLRMVKA